MPQESARSQLEVQGSDLVFVEADGTIRWRLAIAKLVLIAEHTTNSGPWLDDYFLEFGTICDGEPCLTECVVPGGSEACLEVLGARLGAKLSLKLVSCTDFASRVMWPPRLAGRPLFVQRETAQHVGLARLKRRLFGGRTEWIVSAEVFDAMRASHRDLPVQ